MARTPSARGALRANAPAPNPPPSAPSAVERIALVRSNSIPTLVQHELERMILAGDLAGGAKLNEETIAERLGVSRGPVREAFRALEQAGLVRTEKNRGVFVRLVTLDEANEISEVRAVLDGLVGRLAAERIRPAQLARLRDIVRRMQAVSRTRDADAYFPLNLAFHDLLVECTANRALAIHYRRVVNELNLYRREALARDAAHIPVSTRDHETIVEAIAARDGALAERLLREHALASRARMNTLLDPRSRSA
jgi:phosphonate utilization transcriptional regulator